MTYSAEERRRAVEKLVRTSVRRVYGDLGNRVTGTTFEDLQDAAVGLFLQRDFSSFYVVLLARDRLVEFSSSVRTSLGEISELVSSLGRDVQPVENTRSLNNARSALLALSQATGQRTGVYRDIENLPAFLRFERNTDEFLKKEGKKVRFSGRVVETSRRARSVLPGLLVELRGQYDELLRLVDVFVGSIPDFESLNLPARLSQGILQSASEVLSGQIAELEKRTAEDRLEILRDVVLDVLSTRSIVRGFGSLNPPTIFLNLKGQGALYADAEHPAVPARLTADFPGGYTITEGQALLDFVVDSTHNITGLGLPGSFPARLDLIGSWDPPREVFAGRQQLGFEVSDETSSTVYPLSFLPGLYSPEDFIDVANLGFPSAVLEAGLDFAVPRTSQLVDITGAGPTGVTFTSPVAFDFTTANVVVGDYLFLDEPGSAGHLSIYRMTGVSTSTLVADRLTGVSADGEKNVRVFIGEGSSSYPFIRLVDAQAAVDVRRDLSVVDIAPGTASSLGLISGARARSTRTPAQLIAEQVQRSPQTFVAGAVRLTAEAEVVPDETVGLQSARSHPEDSSSLTLYVYSGSARVNSATELELLGPISGVVDASSKAFIIRQAPVAADVDNHGFISAVSGSILTVAPVNALSSSIGSVIEVEVGWDVYALGGMTRDDYLVEVDEGTPGTGLYVVTGFVQSSATGQPLPFQFRIDPFFPGAIQAGNRPLFFEATLSRRRVAFVSTSTGVDSRVAAASISVNSAHGEVFSTDPVEAVGSTTWVQLPFIPAQLTPGDRLEVHLTSPSVPDVVRTVQSVESELRLVSLTEPVDLDAFSSLNFTTTGQVPFARIRKMVKQNFDEVAASVKVWLDHQDALKTFRNLDAGLNALLVNDNPTAVQVGTLKNLLTSLESELLDLEELLSDYEAQVVDDVDTLIKSFRAQGADRAVDILLEGRFQDFFQLDIDDASYAGRVKKLGREVQREDLPMRRFNREGFEQEFEGSVLAQIDDVDFTAVPEPTDPLENVDIPEINDQIPGLPVP